MKKDFLSQDVNIEQIVPIISTILDFWTLHSRKQVQPMPIKYLKNTICYNVLMFRRLDVREKLYRTTSVLIWIPSRSDDKSQVI